MKYICESIKCPQGWRPLDPHEIICHGDVYLSVLEDNPYNPHSKPSGSVGYSFAKYCAINCVALEDRAAWPYRKVKRVLPGNPHYSSPLPLP